MKWKHVFEVESALPSPDLPPERRAPYAGIWNTGWELGGSLGFIAAGFAETDSWRQQQYVPGARTVHRDLESRSLSTKSARY